MGIVGFGGWWACCGFYAGSLQVAIEPGQCAFFDLRGGHLRCSELVNEGSAVRHNQMELWIECLAYTLI